MEQPEVPCVKQCERFYYVDCNIFYFGQIKLWYIRYRLCAAFLFPMVYVGCFTTKKYLVAPDVFRGR